MTLTAAHNLIKNGQFPYYVQSNIGAIHINGQYTIGFDIFESADSKISNKYLQINESWILNTS